MKVKLLDGRVDAFNEGQATSQRFFEQVLHNCVDAHKLGNSPLRVTNHTPGIELRVVDPLRQDYWLGPDTDFDDLADQFVTDRIDDMAIRDRFFGGDLPLRSRVWQLNGGKEIAFLSNKPTRRIITVKLEKGDSIALENSEGKPFVLTR